MCDFFGCKNIGKETLLKKLIFWGADRLVYSYPVGHWEEEFKYSLYRLGLSLSGFGLM